MDLFEYMSEKKSKEESPLASRMRPKQLNEIVGQFMPFRCNFLQMSIIFENFVINLCWRVGGPSLPIG